MKHENRKAVDFKDKILPNFEFFLQFSLLLVKNGRDAARLMREAMAEAYQLWDESVTNENSKMWVHEILTRRFFDGFERSNCRLVTIIEDDADENFCRNNMLFYSTTIDASRHQTRIGESREDIDFGKIMTGLPEKFRSAMILSYLEGFSNAELANLADVSPGAVELLIHRGNEFMSGELFANLMENIGFDSDRGSEAGVWQAER
jgi:DNA-directed RNA polymerase specialized sigma24 family protein